MKESDVSETSDMDEVEDLTKSVWLPVIVENKNQLEQILKNDPTVKEMDLAEISEKEVFVRKANIVSFYTLIIFLERF